MALPSELDVGVRGLSRIRKYPERFRRLRKSFLRTQPEPGSFRATAQTAITIDLAWTNTLTSTTGVTTKVERQPVTGPLDTWFSVADFASTNQTTTASGLVASTTYRFRISHEDGVGRSKYVIIEAATTA